MDTIHQECKVKVIYESLTKYRDPVKGKRHKNRGIISKNISRSKNPNIRKQLFMTPSSCFFSLICLTIFFYLGAFAPTIIR